VPGKGTRPILDRVKTALFDILRPDIAGLRILDLFAGSGAVGIEALSQGAAHCTFLDLDRKAVKTIQDNLAETGLVEQAEVIQVDAFSYLRHAQDSFDLIYVAPPQYRKLWLLSLRAVAERPDLLTRDGRIIVQIDPREYEQFQTTELEEFDQRRYGNTMLVFFRRNYQ